MRGRNVEICMNIIKWIKECINIQKSQNNLIEAFEN